MFIFYLEMIDDQEKLNYPNIQIMWHFWRLLFKEFGNVEEFDVLLIDLAKQITRTLDNRECLD